MIIDKVIYIESSLQFMSSFDYLSKNKKLNFFKIHRDNFYEDKLKGVDIFYERIQKDSLKYPNIHIINT